MRSLMRKRQPYRSWQSKVDDLIKILDIFMEVGRMTEGEKKLMAKTPDTFDMVRQPGGRCRARSRHRAEPPQMGSSMYELKTDGDLDRCGNIDNLFCCLSQ